MDMIVVTYAESVPGCRPQGAFEQEARMGSDAAGGNVVHCMLELKANQA